MTVHSSAPLIRSSANKHRVNILHPNFSQLNIYLSTNLCNQFAISFKKIILQNFLVIYSAFSIQYSHHWKWMRDEIEMERQLGVSSCPPTIPTQLSCVLELGTERNWEELSQLLHSSVSVVWTPCQDLCQLSLRFVNSKTFNINQSSSQCFMPETLQ